MNLWGSEDGHQSDDQISLPVLKLKLFNLPQRELRTSSIVWMGTMPILLTSCFTLILILIIFTLCALALSFMPKYWFQYTIHLLYFKMSLSTDVPVTWTMGLKFVSPVSTHAIHWTGCYKNTEVDVLWHFAHLFVFNF